MLRKLALASALSLVITAPAAAAGHFTLTFNGQPTALAGNDFSTLLGALDSVVDAGAGVTLVGDSFVDFFYLGSQGEGASTFSLPGLAFTEGADANNFASPVFIGSQYYGGGVIDDWNFGSTLGVATSLGNAGFGIYVASSAVSPLTGVASLLLGYEDLQGLRDDGADYDDLVILAQIRDFSPPGPVPEPGAWAILIVGFAMAGSALRRARPARA